MPTNRDHDPILALCANYFYRSRKLHELLHDARSEYEAIIGEDERDRFYRRELSIYLDLWISSLLPLSEGFRKLGLKDAKVDGLIREVMGALRSAGKAVSSYVDDTEYKRGTGRLLTASSPNLNAAEDLYLAFENYFEAYLTATLNSSDRPPALN
jgi:hypothetical protein